MKRIIVTLAFFVLSLALVACGAKAQDASIMPTPTPAPFEGKVTLVYQYETLPKWVEMENLPLTEDVPISFNNDEGWSEVEISMIPYEGVELFSLEANSPDYYHKKEIIGGCHWVWYGRESDDDTLYNEWWHPWADANYNQCTSLEKGASLADIVVSMAYCRPFENGTLCTKQGLTVLIESDSISFTAEGTFLPQYREWVEQVVKYFGGYPELPEVLQPNYNYTLFK
ncbi:hypothetical protein KKC62_01185 [Patescibacteria group bacterium]|nr:hypothetical protein [Patescibacteria group bacterium]MBU1952813.1 hypothetical protein [Patescibacteria group bacterium]